MSNRMMNVARRSIVFAAACTWSGLAMTASAQPATQPASTAKVVVHLDQPAKAISPDLFGIFFEDLNHAADGGLYAELVQNRSFDFQATENIGWNALTCWELIQRNGGRGAVSIDAAVPIHANNPTYAVLEVGDARGDVGLSNTGFDGIAVKAGESYEAALFARHLYSGGRWGQHPATRPSADGSGPLVVRLETKSGEVLAEAALPWQGEDWTRLTATLTPSRSEADARFVVLMKERGGVALDMVSLFPKKTFRDRPNGLRADLAQAIADLKPKFVRFPGGCLVHGNGLGNAYRWKETIGPIEQRKGQSNLWRYHQSMGLGYYEYFQFCEDIGAKPLPVVPAAVSCQNSGFTGGTGQKCVPIEDMPAYIQDILDLIEWANGPASSTWGAKRAAAGHPEPFGLKYLGIGNEENITPGFKERFTMIYNAVHAKHPEITIIGTVGPSPAGSDYEEGWKLANELGVPVVDEHYYEAPEWFRGNQSRYDAYDRDRSKVYIGEYASRGNSLGNALAEAAYMTSLERNGDVVQLASYAPLLCKHGHVGWYPDLIYFNNTNVFPSVNYSVQQLFGQNAGSSYLPTEVSQQPQPAKDEALAISSVRDAASGAIILKLVNTTDAPISTAIELAGGSNVEPEAALTVLQGDPKALNPGDGRARGSADAKAIVPVDSRLPVAKSFTYTVPANSLSVLRIKASS